MIDNIYFAITVFFSAASGAVLGMIFITIMGEKNGNNHASFSTNAADDSRGSAGGTEVLCGWESCGSVPPEATRPVDSNLRAGA